MNPELNSVAFCLALSAREQARQSQRDSVQAHDKSSRYDPKGILLICSE